MNGHECYIIGAGDFFGLREIPDDSDYVIAAAATTRSQTCNRFSTLQTARQEDGCSAKTACGRR